MSAAVAQRNSPHVHHPASRTHSPMDSKRNTVVKSEADKVKKEQPTEDDKKTETSPLQQVDTTSNTKQPPSASDKPDVKPVVSNAETAQPLAPPPRPSQPNASDTSDYFSGQHSTHYSLEPNLFEQSFGNPSTDTPGKSLLPPVASLTSPAPLTGNTSLGGGYSWQGSLRSGPLSPAMLSGPAGGGDYFQNIAAFPTPNESSLRTGLTPGGGGSMFPAPSPGTQAFYSQLASSGGATPSTLDFQRTAANAASANRTESSTTVPTSQPQTSRTQVSAMDATTQQQASNQHFGQHDNDAANGLFLLAQAGNESQANNQFSVPAQPAHVTNQEAPSKRPGRNNNGSVGGSISAASAQGQSELSGGGSDGETKPSTKKSKRASTGKSGSRRKAEDTPVKQPAKKAKSNNGAVHDISMDDVDSDEMPDEKEDQYHENGKKMTDEEKRKNFLERNRVAALKCRQRKKQWLANLQAKVELFSNENDALNAQVQQMREEILNLKTILIAHKDCPIAQQQQSGNAPYLPHSQADYNNHPYGMMQQAQPVMAGPNGQRRYS